jgi:hypothetical protein
LNRIRRSLSKSSAPKVLSQASHFSQLDGQGVISNSIRVAWRRSARVFIGGGPAARPGAQTGTISSSNSRWAMWPDGGFAP